MDTEMDQFDASHIQKGRIEHLALFGNYLDRLESEVKEADRRLEEIQPELSEEQGKVMQARKQRRIVEILQERARARYDKALRKEQRKELEELNIMKSSQQEWTQQDDIYGMDQEQDESKARPPKMDRETTQEEEFRELEADKPKDPVAEYLKEHGLEKPS